MHNTKKKIIILLEENYKVRRGSFNATLNRIKHLMAANQFDIEVYSVLPYMSRTLSLLRRTRSTTSREVSAMVDGVKLSIKWIPYTIIDYISEVKLHRSPIIRDFYTRSLLSAFKDCDLISAHSTLSGSIALECHKKYSLPYTVTWHGSDIHTLPLTNKLAFTLTRDIISNASMNFFVSHDLMKKSNQIIEKKEKTVLYNGVDKTVFYKKDRADLADEAKVLNIDFSEKNVAFVGNFLDIKNVKSLPEVFLGIKNRINHRVCFHFVGDGKYEQYLRQKCKAYQLDSNFILNARTELMPTIYNCMDLVVLPSLNEGLPLVAVESLACGTMLVGSRVGGIAEVVGDDNTVPLGNDFINQFADLCANRLINPVVPNLPSCFDWDKTAQREVQIYNDILL